MKQPSLKTTLGLIIVLAWSNGTAVATNRPSAANSAILEAAAGVIGEVVAVANENRGRLLTVKTDEGAMFSIVVDEATEVKRLSAGERSIENAWGIAADDIAPGDWVYARGAHPDSSGTGRARQLIVMSRIDMRQKIEDERREWQSIDVIPAQQVAGSLRGHVTDQMDAAITGATLSLIRKNRAERRAVTNSQGAYLVDGLAPGSYTLRLEVAGFAPFENDQVSIQAGSCETLDITLQATVREK